jgi:ABC-type maltose transport system permease subunit
MAGSLLILTPVIVLFFLAQKTFIQGIATTGMKG